ncbi:hypothetical protein EV384_1468 [Micromonospora kangleipakensis]|uniref:Repeat protein (TIGR01451 family) n=1 Tax=Micromonospora kangleipakensis TaxID=1077942 RepID=A0A4Q8B7I6_9ACTN|nr:hypothetical protein [Micromonospora kangleipakensis]RZU73071.1 hypothetical protein EV384_1468 [Micromonospora kangleipakensis]
MADLPVRPDRRVAQRRTSALLAASLAVGLATAVAVGPAWATASPTPTAVVTAATDPGGEPAADPTDSTPPAEPTATDPTSTEAPPTESAPPETTPPAPTTTEPVPATTAPDDPAPTTTAPTTAPAPPPPPVVPPAQPPAPPGPGRPAPAQLGVRVTTEDVALTPAYWNADSTVTTLRVTVTNTGGVPELIRLAYRLPAGLTDAGTAGCAPAGGGSYRCGGWTTAPGARFSSSIRVRIDGAAWRSMPLSGSVGVTATAPGLTGAAVDDEGFAVLFPPGPPVPGISLRADEVLFDISGAPSVLTVRLGNTGRVDAAGRVEVILPDGVTASGPPAGCVPLAPIRTRCDLGMVPAGRTATLRLPVTATPAAQARAPLAGAVVGRLDPRSGRSRQVQMSFRINAAAAVSTPVATPAPTGSHGVLAAAEPAADGGGFSSVRRTAITLIAVSGLLVVLALVLATTSLRRRMTAPPADPTVAPAASE